MRIKIAFNCITQLQRVHKPHLLQYFRLHSNRAMSQGTGKPKVYVTRYVPPVGVQLLSEHCEVTQWDTHVPVPRDELIKNIRGKDALFCLLTDKIDKEVLDAAGDQLKIVATMSVGYEHINLQECKRRDIPVGYTPDVLTNATAELTVALLLTTSRKICQGIRSVKDGTWGTWDPVWLCGQGLDGATVGIVGLGRIGFAVAKCLQPFGVAKILYSGHKPKPYAEQIRAEMKDLDTLLGSSDFVIGCCALTEETKNLFNAETFKKMKKNAIFINTSRGGLVNQSDLYEALTTGQIMAAGLDVTSPEPLPTDSPLLTLDNCVILPHIGSATDNARAAMSELTARNILAALRGDAMPCRVPV